MNRPLLLNSLLTVGVLIISLAQSALAGPPPQEPSEAYLVHEDVNIITGLYTREYSLTNNSIVDYKTARQIIISEYNEYWNSVVKTKEFPLFYWHDADHDGGFEMWVDQKMEGCTCDIHPYEPLQVNEKSLSVFTAQ